MSIQITCDKCGTHPEELVKGVNAVPLNWLRVRFGGSGRIMVQGAERYVNISKEADLCATCLKKLFPTVEDTAMPSAAEKLEEIIYEIAEEAASNAQDH